MLSELKRKSRNRATEFFKGTMIGAWYALVAVIAWGLLGIACDWVPTT